MEKWGFYTHFKWTDSDVTSEPGLDVTSEPDTDVTSEPGSDITSEPVHLKWV